MLWRRMLLCVSAAEWQLPADVFQDDLLISGPYTSPARGCGAQAADAMRAAAVGTLDLSCLDVAAERMSASYSATADEDRNKQGYTNNMIRPTRRVGWCSGTRRRRNSLGRRESQDKAGQARARRRQLEASGPLHIVIERAGRQALRQSLVAHVALQPRLRCICFLHVPAPSFPPLRSTVAQMQVVTA